MNAVSLRPTLKRYDLARHFGMSNSQRFSYSTLKRIERLLWKLNMLMTPQLHYQPSKIDSIDSPEVVIEGGRVFRSFKLSKVLADCEEIICFVATIGGGAEKEIARLSHRNRLSDAYVLDSLGSVAVEKVVERFHQNMTIRYESKGKGLTLRFSPGYCDWPVTEQKNLFKLFNPDVIDVELLDSYLMAPRKSISGVFGIYHDSRKRPYNPCVDCQREHCTARRALRSPRLNGRSPS